MVSWGPAGVKCRDRLLNGSKTEKLNKKALPDDGRAYENRNALSLGRTTLQPGKRSQKGKPRISGAGRERCFTSAHDRTIADLCDKSESRIVSCRVIAQLLSAVRYVSRIETITFARIRRGLNEEVTFTSRRRTADVETSAVLPWMKEARRVSKSQAFGSLAFG